MKQTQKQRRNRAQKFRRDILSNIDPLIIFIIHTAFLLLPLLWMVLTSFKGLYDFSENVLGLPEKWLFSNYSDALKNMVIPVGGRKVYMEEMLLNSFVYVVSYTVMPLLGNCFVAYACAKYKSKFGAIVYNLVIFMMIFPVIGNLSSALNAARIIKTYDNIIWASIMNCTFKGTNFLIFYAVFKGISWEYAEAAFIDGAGHFTIMVRIMLPMAASTIGALAITTVIGTWNDWNTPLVWFPSHPTIAYGLYHYSNVSGGNTMAGVPIQFAAATMSAIPMVLIFIIFRKKIIGNVSFGGLKG